MEDYGLGLKGFEGSGLGFVVGGLQLVISELEFRVWDQRFKI